MRLRWLCLMVFRDEALLLSKADYLKGLLVRIPMINGDWARDFSPDNIHRTHLFTSKLYRLQIEVKTDTV